MNFTQTEMQLIEATVLARETKHTPIAVNPETCELCESLVTLRARLTQPSLQAVNVEVHRRLFK